MAVTAKDINGNEIKVGDTVERVEDTISPYCELVVGNTYLVERISSPTGAYLRLKGLDGSYCTGKFKVIPSKNKPFTKSDLKDGMVVTYRKGWKRVIFKGILYDLTSADLIPSSDIEYYNDVLQHDKHNDMDIVKVEYMNEVLWEREEPLTEEQLRIKELEEGIAKMQEELNKLL